MRNLILLTLIGLGQWLMAQTDSITKPQLHFGGFVEGYYGYDFGRPDNHARPCFLYNHARAGEFAVNLALLQVSVEHARYRAHLGLQGGTYVQANLRGEPAALRLLNEANVGVALGKKARTWLDAGIFSSYIGFESAISTDNLTLSRSLCAENTPYYMSGLRLVRPLGDRWEATAYLLNGWQTMRIANGKTLPSVGTQLRWQAREKLLLNWSTYIGSEDPDSSRRMRYFSNLYLQAQPHKRLALTVGFDIGAQHAAPNNTRLQHWLSPVVIAQYSLSDRFSIVARAEYYADEHQVIVDCPPSTAPFSAWGASLGANYHPYENIFLRVEARGLQSPNAIFETPTGLRNNNLSLLGSIAVRIP